MAVKKPTNKVNAKTTVVVKKTTFRTPRQSPEKAAAPGPQETSLLLNEAVYKRIVDTMDDSLTVLDGEGNILFANSAAVLNLSDARSNVVGKNISRFMPAAQAIVRIEQYRRVIATGRPLEQEVMVTLKGSDRWFLNSLRPISFGGHAVPALVSSSRDITKRKKNEGALKSSETELNEAQKLAKIGSWSWNAAADMVEWSEELFRINGRDHALPAPGLAEQQKLYTPESWAQLKGAIEHTLATGKPYKLELQVYRADGELIWLAARGEVIQDDKGGIVGLRGTAQDITERVNVEEELHKVRTDLELFFSVVPDLLCIASTDGYFKHLNHEWEKSLGFTVPELLSKPLETWIHPDDVAQTYAAVEQQTKGKPVVSFVNRYRRKDGTYRWLEWNVTPAYGTLLYGAARDITERKRTEEIIAESKQRLSEALEFNKSILKTSSIGVLTYDKTGQCIYSNEAAAKIIGTNVAGLLSQNFHQIESWKKNGMHEAALRALRTNKEQQSEDHIITTFGKDIWLSLRYSTFYSDGEQHLLLLIQDITERKKLEDTRMFLVECGTKGDDFFQSLAQYLAGSLNMDYVCIDRLEGDQLTARTVAVYFDGKFEDNVSYTLYDTPCGEVVGRDVCCFPEEVRHRFPKDTVLEDMKAESYVGVTLWSHTHQPVGLIAVIGRRPLEDKSLAESILMLAAIRAAAELERKLDEEKLRESNESYRILFDQDPLPRWIYDVETFSFLLVNKAAQAHYGYTMEEFTSMTIKDVRPSEDVEKILSFSARISDKPAVSHSWKHRKKDGSLIDVDIHSHPIRFMGRKARRVLVKDITERKQAEEKVRRSESFIRNILDTVDEGFIVIDRDYRILTANKAYCGQVEMPCDDVIGKRCYEVSHKKRQPCSAEGEDCAARQAFETGTPRTVTHQHRDAHGGVVYVEAKCFPIKDGTGVVTSVIETINNITERHLLEEERLKTQKLESIGTLAGGIAHDFNNLLQGVFGYISMARLTFDQKEKSLAMLEQAEKALHQSVNLTTQLLTFSKGGKPVKKTMSLAPVVENAVKFALSGSRSEYQLNIDRELWQVNGDAGQLGQVIQNIVLNADQAMPLGGVVKISAWNAAAGDASLPSSLAQGNYIVLTIEDNGVGISEQYQSRIFDPYFTTKEKGSGLGLATSYSIVRNHEGQIRVFSTVGKGTVFKLFIPAMTVKAGAGTAVQAAFSAPSSARILAMDDEAIIRDLTKELLRALGNEVEVAAHGEEALTRYREAAGAGRPFDIVILDLTVRGGLGGVETVRKLLEFDPAAKAVVSSGYSADDAIANYREYGFKAFLKKPYNVQELQNVLHALSAK